MVARYFSGGEFMGGKDVLMGHASTENRSLVTYLYTVVHTCLEYNLEFPNLIRSLRHLAAGQTFSPPQTAQMSTTPQKYQPFRRTTPVLVKSAPCPPCAPGPGWELRAHLGHGPPLGCLGSAHAPRALCWGERSRQKTEG